MRADRRGRLGFRGNSLDTSLFVLLDFVCPEANWPPTEPSEDFIPVFVFDPTMSGHVFVPTPAVYFYIQSDGQAARCADYCKVQKEGTHRLLGNRLKASGNKRFAEPIFYIGLSSRRPEQRVAIKNTAPPRFKEQFVFGFRLRSDCRDYVNHQSPGFCRIEHDTEPRIRFWMLELVSLRKEKFCAHRVVLNTQEGIFDC